MEELVMGKNFIKNKDTRRLEIPQVNVLDLNVLKFERIVAYVRHKLPKQLKKEELS